LAWFQTLRAHGDAAVAAYARRGDGRRRHAGADNGRAIWAVLTVSILVLPLTIPVLIFGVAAALRQVRE
jgi:hypothetical protein